jgi:uncharacterized membrane protein
MSSKTLGRRRIGVGPARSSNATEHARDNASVLAGPGIVLGLGLGGFVDGIVLHQILQWHHMLTDTQGNPATTVSGLETNTLADGLFHAGTWLLVALGLAMLWRVSREASASRVSGLVLVGWMLAGWGIFNLVEGTVDHLLLGIHHVREGGNERAWDLAFLALGVAQLVAGMVLARRASRSTPAPGATPAP